MLGGVSVPELVSYCCYMAWSMWSWDKMFTSFKEAQLCSCAALLIGGSSQLVELICSREMSFSCKRS